MAQQSPCADDRSMEGGDDAPSSPAAREAQAARDARLRNLDASPSAPQWPELPGRFSEKIAEQLALLRGELPLTPQSKVKKKSLKDAATQVRGQAAKVGLMLARVATAEEANGVLGGLADSVDVYISWALGMMAGVGPTTRTQIRTLSEAMITAVEKLNVAALSGGGDSPPTSDLKPLIGRLWARCDEIDDMKVDELTLIGRKITELLALIKDARSELVDAIENPPTSEPETEPEPEPEPQPAGSSPAAHEDEEQDDCEFSDDDDIGEDEELSAEERLVLPRADAVVERVLEFSKCVLRCLLLLQGDRHERDAMMLLSGATDLPNWNKDSPSLEPLLVLMQSFSTSVDEIVCGAVYSPQDRASVAKHASALRESVQSCTKLVSEAMSAAARDGAKCAAGVNSMQEAGSEVEETAKELAVFLEFVGS